MIEQLVRPNIRSLTPYKSARDEFSGEAVVFLDANENPFGNLNRYPDPHQAKLKSVLSEIKHIPVSNLFLGNGSDEVIDLAFRIFCEPGRDKILICPPTYGMYRVAADINNVGVAEVPLDSDFDLDVDAVLQKAHAENVKILFLCNPNNPTGNNVNGIEKILREFKGIVFLDEAYNDFSSTPSFIYSLKEYPNLIVSQTLSKAFGLAGARIGMAFASEEIIGYFNRVKPPYNLSRLNQDVAISALEDFEQRKDEVGEILRNRDTLIEALSRISLIKKIYPTEANFILVKTEQPDSVYRKLVERGIIIRNRNFEIPGTLRISVGTKHENQQLIEALENL